MLQERLHNLRRRQAAGWVVGIAEPDQVDSPGGPDQLGQARQETLPGWEAEVLHRRGAPEAAGDLVLLEGRARDQGSAGAQDLRQQVDQLHRPVGGDDLLRDDAIEGGGG